MAAVRAPSNGDRNWKADNRPGLDAVERDAVEFFFLGSRETPILGGPAGVIGREAEFRALGEQLEFPELRLVRNEVPKRGPVVVGAEVQLDPAMGRGAFFESNDHLVVMVSRLFRFAGHDGIGLVVRVAANGGDLLPGAPGATLPEVQRQRGIFHKGLALKQHTVSGLLTRPQPEKNLHPAVG